jgi:hypothetical protein
MPTDADHDRKIQEIEDRLKAIERYLIGMGRATQLGFETRNVSDRLNTIETQIGNNSRR